MQHKWGKDFCTAVCRLIFFLILFMDVHPKATGLCTATTPKRLRMATTPSSWIAGKLRATSSSSWPRSAGAAEASCIMHFSLGYFKGYILWLFGFNHFNLAHCEIHHCLASVWHAVRCWFAFFGHPLVLQKAAIQENRFAAVMRRDPKHAQESCMDVCCEGSNFGALNSANYANWPLSKEQSHGLHKPCQ